MKKDKKPGKRRNPSKGEDSASEETPERQTEEQAQLVPPARRPPTAVGAETPPPPPPPPRPLPAYSGPPPEHRPARFRLLDDVRAAVVAMLDIADAVAAAITKGLQRGA